LAADRGAANGHRFGMGADGDAQRGRIDLGRHGRGYGKRHLGQRAVNVMAIVQGGNGGYSGVSLMSNWFTT
jgi:hypothetical protein